MVAGSPEQPAGRHGVKRRPRAMALPGSWGRTSSGMCTQLVGSAARPAHARIRPAPLGLVNLTMWDEGGTPLPLAESPPPLPPHPVAASLAHPTCSWLQVRHAASGLAIAAVMESLGSLFGSLKEGYRALGGAIVSCPGSTFASHPLVLFFFTSLPITVSACTSRAHGLSVPVALARPAQSVAIFCRAHEFAE